MLRVKLLDVLLVSNSSFLCIKIPVKDRRSFTQLLSFMYTAYYKSLTSFATDVTITGLSLDLIHKTSNYIIMAFYYAFICIFIHTKNNNLQVKGPGLKVKDLSPSNC